MQINEQPRTAYLAIATDTSTLINKSKLFLYGFHAGKILHVIISTYCCEAFKDPDPLEFIPLSKKLKKILGALSS